MEFLYIDGTQYCFMNTSTWSQEFLSEDQLGESRSLIKENTKCTVLFFEEKPIGVALPNFIVLKIIKTDPWTKGDTASGSTKTATLETGFIVQVPPFIEEGEMIRIDTRTGEYVERVKA
jgi:elongation factor P